MTEQGNRWLLTRPDPMNGVLSRELTALGDAAWVHPLLCIEPLAEAALRLAEEPFPWKHVIFTSQPAVEYSSALLAWLGDNHGLASTCYAVGDATQSKLAEYGIKALSGKSSLTWHRLDQRLGLEQLKYTDGWDHGSHQSRDLFHKMPHHKSDMIPLVERRKVVCRRDERTDGHMNRRTHDCDGRRNGPSIQNNIICVRKSNEI